jgi:hypothetical protein
MKYFTVLILLFSINIDSNKLSYFPRLNDDAPKFTSTSLEHPQWSSDSREYCFFRKELSYLLQYEFSPVPIPAFKIKNSSSDIYITVDIDPAHPIRFQRLKDAWESFSMIGENRKICFDGAYLPPSSPNDSAYIMIDQIKTESTQLALKDYWMALD